MELERCNLSDEEVRILVEKISNERENVSLLRNGKIDENAVESRDCRGEFWSKVNKTRALSILKALGGICSSGGNIVVACICHAVVLAEFYEKLNTYEQELEDCIDEEEISVEVIEEDIETEEN